MNAHPVRGKSGTALGAETNATDTGSTEMYAFCGAMPFDSRIPFGLNAMSFDLLSLSGLMPPRQCIISYVNALCRQPG